MYGKVYIEKPITNQKYIRPDETKISVEGWAVSGDLNSGLQILIDGNKVNSTITKISRPDVDSTVSRTYGGVSTTPNAGFKALVDISSLGKGKHTIKVQMISRYGELIGEASTSINIENKKYSRKNQYRKANSKSKLYKAK